MSEPLLLPARQASDEPDYERHITDKTAEKWALAAKVDIGEFREVKAAAKLGKYAKHQILENLPALMLVDAYSRIKKALADCDAALAKELTPDARAVTLHIQRDHIQSMIKLASTIVTVRAAQHTMRQDKKKKQRSFRPGEAVQPTQAVQVNIGITPDNGVIKCQQKSISNPIQAEIPPETSRVANASGDRLMAAPKQEPAPPSG